jgi:hypothetical protein
MLSVTVLNNLMFQNFIIDDGRRSVGQLRLLGQGGLGRAHHQRPPLSETVERGTSCSVRFNGRFLFGKLMSFT